MGLFASNIAPDLPRDNQRLSKQKTKKKGLKSQGTKLTDKEGGEYAPMNDFDGQDFSEVEVDQKKKKIDRAGSRSTVNDGVGADSLDNGAVLDNYDADLLERQSVDPLTLKEGYDYENKDFN
mmetsp:Transcript_12110/g.18724  ORF Transcript_12110/g.18724 Transcript_12110/m.18724 type:complete len:122 (+) Transcript_12110:506-871(+)